MSTRRQHPREGSLFSAMCSPEEIAFKNQRPFLVLLVVIRVIELAISSSCCNGLETGSASINCSSSLSACFC